MTRSSRERGHKCNLRLIHVDVWQKPTQYCKAIILQLKINKLKKKEMYPADAYTMLVNEVDIIVLTQSDTYDIVSIVPMFLKCIQNIKTSRIT